MVLARALEFQIQAPMSPEMLSKSISDISSRCKQAKGTDRQAKCQSEDCSAVALPERAMKPVHGFTLSNPTTALVATSTTVHVLAAASHFAQNSLAAAPLLVPSPFPASKQSLSKKGVAPSTERLQRSRERNRIHARKTRLRKKEQMQTLQGKADELKAEQIRLKQVINDKNTANILVGLFATSATDKGACSTSSAAMEDPVIEELLRRPTGDIPDSTNITELPSLILPGQHASKKLKASSASSARDGTTSTASTAALIDDGIDYDLLGKDRAACTPEELDKIRRERNRMHAKRTRDRKRMFMEELAEICRQLEEENELLRSHLFQLDPDYKDEHRDATHEDAETDEEDAKGPSCSRLSLLPESFALLGPKSSGSDQASSPTSSNARNVTFNQIQTLLEAATSFDLSTFQKRGYASVSSDESNDESTLGDSSCHVLAKRKRIEASSPAPLASNSITSTPVGC